MFLYDMQRDSWTDEPRLLSASPRATARLVQARHPKPPPRNPPPPSPPPPHKAKRPESPGSKSRPKSVTDPPPHAHRKPYLANHHPPLSPH